MLGDYLDNFYIAYINNILIYSKDLLEYKEYIAKVINYLLKARLQADIKKSEFIVIETKFLGYIISTTSI